MPTERDNEFRLTVVPIFVVEDQVLLVQRRVVPKKVHAWGTGFLGRDLIGPTTPMQVIEEIGSDLGCGKCTQCTFVASHHERREHPQAKPPYTEFICTVCYLVRLPTTNGVQPTETSDVATCRWVHRTEVYDQLSYEARFWLPFELEEYLRFGVIGKPVGLDE